ncbi:hypothetical protein SAMN06265375_102239 [Muriicola jejuensis]|uniref:DUF2846 domain-containing protein n=1 Tax=Muriicola jejuensis TaxID=504488 RepID=A0A6P0UE72_9FLAO|nr:hypothetical protein [Muriicola jejuensis]NER10780.1 hypothetical protein [Muriicola jejuensis]SMP16267.1 hypothetical protein SAMN06265375_102239 [Muriicola jejuensis]
MKKISLLFAFFIQTTLLFSQASPEKSIVYFTRANSLGALINFTYFDGDKAIGKFNGMGYFIYECEPGEHLFWARSENKSFVQAELEPGKTYLIDVQPRMGGLKASVKLVPVDISEHKMKPIQRLVTKREPIEFSEEELAKIQQDMAEVIGRGMENYDKMLEKEKDIEQLTPEMTITEADLVFEKKDKN